LGTFLIKIVALFSRY